MKAILYAFAILVGIPVITEGFIALYSVYRSNRIYWYVWTYTKTGQKSGKEIHKLLTEDGFHIKEHAFYAIMQKLVRKAKVTHRPYEKRDGNVMINGDYYRAMEHVFK